MNTAADMKLFEIKLIYEKTQESQSEEVTKASTRLH